MSNEQVKKLTSPFIEHCLFDIEHFFPANKIPNPERTMPNVQ
jgi:hypothetical protein